MSSYVEEYESGKLLVAYRRLAHALAAEIGWKPNQVELAIGMASADIREELEVREIDPVTYRATPVKELVNEPAETAAKKGKKYVEQELASKLEDYVGQVMLVGV